MARKTVTLPGAQALALTSLATALAWMVGVGLCYFPAWQTLELKASDLINVVTAPKKSVLPITIVAIDEASFTQLGQRWPWPRSMHARLVERLAQSGAAVIAFDVLFSEPGTKEEDERFAHAIRSAGNVVLTADSVYHETAAARQWLRMDPLPAFTHAGATTGLASMILDGDTVARRMSEAEDAFWRTTVATLARMRPGSIQEPQVPQGALMRHLGPAHTFPYVSYYQVLNGDPGIPADFFADQIVLVGRDVRASPETGGAQADTFATPFLMTSGLLTPGVEIQATQIENALMGQTIQPAPAAWNALALTTLLLLTYPALAYWHPLRSGLLVALAGGIYAGISVWLFDSMNLFLAIAAPLLSLGSSFVGTGLGAFFIEKRRAGELRTAFTKYVSREVVEQLIAHPERLRLGGERRDVTLLFSDLAGFTSVSEQLIPEKVAILINLYFSEMTQVIMAHNGTVDKFIGDAVMAFWGAPLDDPEHALHAVQAAVEMQQRMDRLQPRFADLGAGPIGLRIGLHSGPAIIGNMGSNLRFSYTAMGDTVNLASRLEGVNKLYGTRIVLSSATAHSIRDEVSLRRVDRVRVKGKDTAVDIFTPCDDATLCQLTENAWRAYRDCDWGGAEQAWTRVRQHAPGDAITELFLERIAGYRAAPPPADWDGSIALEKL